MPRCAGGAPRRGREGAGLGRASRKRASKRAGTYVDPHPPKENKPAPPPRQPFSWAKAKNFVIYGVAVLLASTLALSTLPSPWQVAGAAGVYLAATLGVIVYRTAQWGWPAMRRRTGLVGLVALGVTAAGWGLSFMKRPLVNNPFFGVLLGILLAGTGRILFPPEGDTRPAA
jgi:hypothetical protein